MQPQGNTLSSRAEVRARHLVRLWQESLSGETLPQYDRWISEQFKRHPGFGSRDRRWYSELLFGGIRHGYFALFAEFVREHPGHGAPADAEALFTAFRNHYRTPAEVRAGLKAMPPDRLFAWVAPRLLKSDASLVDDDLLALPFPPVPVDVAEIVDGLLTQDSLTARLVNASIPLWLQGHLERRVSMSGWSPESTARFLDAQTRRPPLWLRLNFAERETEVVRDLEREGFEVQLHGQALAVQGGKGIFATTSFREGHVEIQDFASQRIGARVEALPGQLVWDSCAGGGGKTLQIASFLQNRGAVYASDVREYKLDEVRKRARRAGFHNVRCVGWDGRTVPVFPREVEKRGGFDWVLVDAPCSSTGTWRRNPDAKYRIEDANITNLEALQESILDVVARAVRPGGCLVYSTCSWTPGENEDVVTRFAARHPEFSWVQGNLEGAPESDADTMFAAVLRKRN